MLGRWLFNADDPEMDEGFGVKFARHKVCVHMYVHNTLLVRTVLLERQEGLGATTLLYGHASLRGRHALGTHDSLPYRLPSHYKIVLAYDYLQNTVRVHYNTRESARRRSTMT